MAVESPAPASPGASVQPPTVPTRVKKARRARRRTEPSHPPAGQTPDDLLNVAQKAFNQGALSEARESAEAALRRGGGVPALVMLADVHVRLGRDQEGDARARALRKALSLYDRALASDPRNDVAKSGRDYARRMMNRSPGDDPARPSALQTGNPP